MLNLRLAPRMLIRIAAVAAALSLRVFISAPATAHAQQQQPKTGFQLREFKDDEGTHKYSLFVPKGYSTRYKWPLIVYLHGAGERGRDGILPTTIGLGPLVKLREANFPFIVVFPQIEDTHGRIITGWNPHEAEGRRALKILEQVEKDFSVDTKREVLTGWSMGGYGAWQMAAADPDRWLSVVAVSGGGDEALAQKLKNTPLWLFHGAKDNIVAPENTRKLAAAVDAAGGKARFTDVPDGDHNVWKKVYDDDKLYAWMLYPQRDFETLKPFTSRPATAAGQAVEIPEAPFVPAVDVSRAVYVRLGNDALTSLADAIPKVVKPETLTGWLNPISEYTHAQGYTFSVTMSGLSYSAQLYRAVVKAYAKDRINVQLGLSNVQVTIGGTSIQGKPGGATAGPMRVVIGHVRPVWLSFDVAPVVVDRKLRLRHLSTGFSIPGDNWYVSSPAGVDANFGLFGPSEGEIAGQLVSGIYGRKATIEQQVASVVPSLIREMENQLDVTQMGQAVGSIWPLPVYQPRLRLWPAEVSADEKGVSLVLGVTAAAVDPARPPQRVKSVQAGSFSIASVPRTTNLRIGMTPELMAPLTELLIESDVARVHVADTPSEAMARLAEPDVISDVIPDLKRYGDRLQTYAELVLAGPIHVVENGGDPVTAGATGVVARPASAGRAASAPQTRSRQLALEAPQVKIVVSIKTEPGAARWKPCAEFDVALRQAASPQLLKPDYQTRAVAVHWEGEAQLDVKGRFAPGYEPQERTLDLAKFRSLFSAGWDEYIKRDRPVQLTLPDVELGFAKLRAADAGWDAPSLFAAYGPAGVKITNSSDKSLVYETKGPYSGWGGPYTLKPGDSHDFPISYPLGFRRRTDASYQNYTLPAGTHSEFWTPKAGYALGLYQARSPEQLTRSAASEKDEKATSKTP
ncbi:MAG: alpha/beta hydrolase-fold protein [Planctomycetaceae bacterium]